MDEANVEELKRKLREINKFISELDAAIRPLAFEILAPMYFEEAEPLLPKRRQPVDKADGDPTQDRETFYSSFQSEKPADNVLLIAAWFFSQYGVYPITRKDIEDEARDAGLTVPTRPDITMRKIAREGKKLFRKQGNGWQLTVSGEAYLKESYKVMKGNKSYPGENPE